MEFVPYRLLRNQPNELRKRLEKGELVVTVDGQPLAVMFKVPQGSLEDLALVLSQVRAQLAVASIREKARQSGLGSMTVEEADTVVQETRASRRKRKPA